MTDNIEGLSRPHFSNQSVLRSLLDRFAPCAINELDVQLNSVRSRIKKVVGTIALIGATTFIADSLLAQYEASLTKPAILQVEAAEHTYDRDNAIVISGGYGLRNAYSIAETLKGFSSEGHVWSTLYDNRGINAKPTVEIIMERAEAQGVKNIALWGDSMGGTLSLEEAVIIQKSDTNLRVPYIVLENTPSSLDAVRIEQRNNAQLLLSSTDIPLLAYSRIAQSALQIGAQHKNYLDEGFDVASFFETVGRVDSQVNSKYAPSMALLGSQYSTIVTSNVEKNIMELGKSEEYGKPKPVLVLIRPVSDTSDRVVDSDIMENEYREYAKNASLRLVIIRMPDITHGDPTMNQQQYADIIPYIVEQVEKTLRSDEVASFPRFMTDEPQ